MEKGRIGLNAGKVWHALNEVNEKHSANIEILCYVA